MAALAVYDSDNFAADQIELSLSQAGEKYSDWQHHQDGARAFAHMTLVIAMREFLYTKKDVERGTLTSVDEVIDKYHSVARWDDWHQERRTSYILWNLKSSCFQYTIGSDLREFAVRHHACGLTTAEVISLVLDKPQGEGLTPLRYYADYFPTMRQTCRDYLSTQLNYLKRGQVRFPKKYNDLWEAARAEHLQEIQHLPLTHVTEQVEAMQQHYQKLKDAFDALPPAPEYTRERERLTNAMMKTMSAIYMMTRDPAYPKPQTRPLEISDTHRQIGDNTNADG